MKKWQIKRKSSIGQQLITVWDSKQNKFVKEIAYGEPNFIATTEEAKQKLNSLKSIQRIPVPIKWIRLYECVGC